jgi:hypothetical protein
VTEPRKCNAMHVTAPLLKLIMMSGTATPSSFFPKRPPCRICPFQDLLTPCSSASGLRRLRFAGHTRSAAQCPLDIISDSISESTCISALSPASWSTCKRWP